MKRAMPDEEEIEVQFNAEKQERPVLAVESP